MSMVAGSPYVSMISKPSQGVDEAWFSAVPSAGKTRELATAFRQFWQHQARMALEAAAEGVGRSLPQLMERVAQLDTRRRISPKMFARLAALMEAMSFEDGYGVFDTLQAWSGDKPEDWCHDELPVESVASHAWEASLLREIRNTQVAGVAPLEFFPLLEADLTPHQNALTQALDLIRQVDQDMHDEIRTHVGLIKLFDGSGIEGLSSPKAFGAIWLKVPAPENALAWFLEHLVHECSHLHLNALMAFDPLLTNPNEINRSPLRPDPRPMFQVLHATFVLFRNRRVHARLHARYPDLGLGADTEEFAMQFESGVAILNEYMKPTPLGQKLLDSMISDGV